MRFLLILFFLFSCQPALGQIEISSGFERKAGVPLDVDAVKADLTERDAIPNLIRYEGMIVYVESEGVNFQLVGGIENENWVEVGSGGGDIVGPNSSTDNAIALFDGITGKLLKESALQIIDESGESTLTTPDGESGTSITIKASNSTEDESAGDVNLEAGTSVNSIYDGAIAFITGAATRLKILATGVIEVAQGSMLSFIDSGLNYVGIRGPTSVNESYTLTLPADPPTNGKALVADETGQLEWGEAGGSGFGGKNYFVDPSFNENVDATRSYRELSFFNDGSGVFTDGGGLGYIVAFTGHGITQNQRVFYYHDGSPLDGSGNVIGVECYAQVLDSDIFGLSPVENGATEPLSDAGGVNSTHYFRIYEESLDHLSASVESASPLIEGGSLKLSFTDDGNSAVGEGIELLTNPIDREDMGKSLLFKVSADGTDDDYPEDDLIFRVVDKTNSKISFIQGNQIKKTKKGYLIDTHLADTTKDLLVSIHVADDNASDDYDVIFGTFSIGPDSVVPGLVEQYEEIDLAGSGDFTAGKIAVSKIGRQVTIVTLETPTFPSSANPSSAPGLLPEWARPAFLKDNNHYTVTDLRSIRVGADGALSFYFRNYAGNALNFTQFGPSASMTYTVPESNSAIFSTTELLNKSTDIVLTRATAPVANQTTNAAQITGFTELTDALGEWDTTTDTFTPRESGKYRLTITANFDAANTGLRALYIHDATSNTFYTLYSVLGTSSINASGSASFEFNLIAGREYRFAYFQNSGGDLDLTVDAASISRVFTPTVYGVYGKRETKSFIDTSTRAVSSPTLGNWGLIPGWTMTLPSAGVYDLSIASLMQAHVNASIGHGEIAFSTSPTPGSEIIKAYSTGYHGTTADLNATKGFQFRYEGFVATGPTTIYIHARLLNVSSAGSVTALQLRNDVITGGGIMQYTKVK